ncbi:unnamed protein product [Strongylus vulgaris]|uniref:Mannose-6-phosphate isomerase n=1 Tax=Strongylus vulgaris TaxID=40348 RepID=A0A3P7IWZ2_STRVU|nr:unnamed protein product [Strongylus vulgaris]
MDLQKPINLHNFIESHKEQLQKDGRVEIYGAPKYSTQVFLYGQGQYKIDASEYEVLIWIMVDSEAALEGPNDVSRLMSSSMTICPPQSKHHLEVKQGQAITIQMMPKL